MTYEQMREQYQAQLAALYARIASGEATPNQLDAFGLVASIYQQAMTERSLDSNLEHTAFIRGHIERQTAALERIADALGGPSGHVP